ncbi:MAG: hypothetical protein IPI83_07540 [Sphingomonadales bacterium]|nr:hypothetical protein [Sphingomonadales bacterium]
MLAYLLLAGTLVTVNADAQPRALILVLLAAWAIAALRPGRVVSGALILATLGLSLYFQHKYGIDKQALRLGAACVVIALIYLAPFPAGCRWPGRPRSVWHSSASDMPRAPEGFSARKILPPATAGRIIKTTPQTLPGKRRQQARRDRSGSRRRIWSHSG